MAVQAKEAGAHALLVYPPRILHTPRSVISYHQEIAQIGLPVIAFYLYEQAGDCRIRTALFGVCTAFLRWLG